MSLIKQCENFRKDLHSKSRIDIGLLIEQYRDYLFQKQMELITDHTTSSIKHEIEDIMERLKGICTVNYNALDRDTKNTLEEIGANIDSISAYCYQRTSNLIGQLYQNEIRHMNNYLKEEVKKEVDHQEPDEKVSLTILKILGFRCKTVTLNDKEIRVFYTTKFSPQNIESANVIQYFRERYLTEEDKVMLKKYIDNNLQKWKDNYKPQHQVFKETQKIGNEQNKPPVENKPLVGQKRQRDEQNHIEEMGNYIDLYDSSYEPEEISSEEEDQEEEKSHVPLRSSQRLTISSQKLTSNSQKPSTIQQEVKNVINTQIAIPIMQKEYQQFFDQQSIYDSIFYFDDKTKKIKRVQVNQKLITAIALMSKQLGDATDLQSLTGHKFQTGFLTHIKKYFKGFGMLNVNLENKNINEKKVETRTLLWGTALTYTQIQEYDFNSHQLQVPFQFQNYKMTKFSHCLYQDTRLFIIGGDENQRPTNANACLDLKIGRDNKLEFHNVDIPYLITPLYNHSTFIVNDYLFVVFGLDSEHHASEVIQYLDINNPKEFKELGMPEIGLYLNQVMLFEHEGRILFIGGNQLQSTGITRRNQQSTSKLYEMIIQQEDVVQNRSLLVKIEHSARQRPKCVVIKEVPNVVFQGQPEFTSQWPTRYYSQEFKTWVFIDLEGNLYLYCPETGKTQKVKVADRNSKEAVKACDPGKSSVSKRLRHH